VKDNSPFRHKLGNKFIIAISAYVGQSLITGREHHKEEFIVWIHSKRWPDIFTKTDPGENM